MSAEGVDPVVEGGEEEDPCGPSSVGKLGLRIGSLFIILVRSISSNPSIRMEINAGYE